MPNSSNYAQANEILKTIKRDPNLVSYETWVTNLDGLAEDERQKIIRELRKLADNEPKYAAVYNDWGNALSGQRRYDEAIEQYREAAQVDPNYHYAYYNWGVALADQKKYEEAIERYRKATEVDPSYASSYYGWGNALLKQKKYDEAITQYEKATNVDPNEVEAYLAWGKALLLLNRDPEADQKFAQATRIDSDRKPSIADRYFSWGSALGDGNRLEGSNSEVSRSDPAEPRRRIFLPQHCLLLGKPGQVSRILVTAGICCSGL